MSHASTLPASAASVSSSSSSSNLFSFKLKFPSFIFATGGQHGQNGQQAPAEDKRKRRNSSAEAPANGTGPVSSPTVIPPSAVATCGSCSKKLPAECRCLPTVQTRKPPKKSGLFRWDPRRHSHAGAPAASGPKSRARRPRPESAVDPGVDFFEDEADLFEGLAPKPQGSSGESHQIEAIVQYP